MSPGELNAWCDGELIATCAPSAVFRNVEYDGEAFTASVCAHVPVTVRLFPDQDVPSVRLEGCAVDGSTVSLEPGTHTIRAYRKRLAE